LQEHKIHSKSFTKSEESQVREVTVSPEERTIV